MSAPFLPEGPLLFCLLWRIGVVKVSTFIFAVSGLQWWIYYVGAADAHPSFHLLTCSMPSPWPASREQHPDTSQRYPFAVGWVCAPGRSSGRGRCNVVHASCATAVATEARSAQPTLQDSGRVPELHGYQLVGAEIG